MSINDRPREVKRGKVARPFADSAWAYHDQGWAPIPVARSGAKAPLVSGITGHLGTDLTRDQLERMAVKYAKANVGLRLGWDILGIDVDAYDGKNGSRTLHQLTVRLGPLPFTWKSTSRMPEDRVSGIYLFRAPRRPEWSWVINLGETSGIDIIQFHHRFAVVAPSIHVDTGRRYMWFLGNTRTRAPSPGDLPLLPVDWARYLRSAQRYRVSLVATDEATEKWYREHDHGPACELMRQAARDGAAEIKQADRNGGLHDTMIRVVTYLCRNAAEGHRGLSYAINAVRDAFTGSGRPRSLANEWTSAIYSAKQKAAALPQSREDPCTEDDLRGIRVRVSRTSLRHARAGKI